MNSLKQRKNPKNFYKSLFLIILFFFVLILSGCARSKIISDQDSFTYDLKENGNIVITINITNGSNRTIESINILIDLYDEEKNYLETISGTSDKTLFGIEIKNYILSSETKDVEIYFQTSNSNIKYVELNKIDFKFEVSIYLVLALSIGLSILFVLTLVYFISRKTEYYDYKGYKITAATKFLSCYIEVDDKRIATDSFFRWGKTIEVNYADIKIIAIFHPGYIFPAITIIIDGNKLQSVS